MWWVFPESLCVFSPAPQLLCSAPYVTWNKRCGWKPSCITRRDAAFTIFIASPFHWLDHMLVRKIYKYLWPENLPHDFFSAPLEQGNNSLAARVTQKNPIKSCLKSRHSRVLLHFQFQFHIREKVFSNVKESIRASENNCRIWFKVTEEAHHRVKIIAICSWSIQQGRARKSHRQQICISCTHISHLV